jgi:hypothetical protein
MPFLGAGATTPNYTGVTDCQTSDRWLLLHHMPQEDGKWHTTGTAIPEAEGPTAALQEAVQPAGSQPPSSTVSTAAEQRTPGGGGMLCTELYVQVVIDQWLRSKMAARSAQPTQSTCAFC